MSKEVAHPLSALSPLMNDCSTIRYLMKIHVQVLMSKRSVAMDSVDAAR